MAVSDRKDKNLKIYESGTIVNINRGKNKGFSGTVESMDEITGNVILSNEYGEELEVTQGTITVPKEGKEMPEFRLENEDESEEVAEKPAKVVVQTECPCGCGLLAAPKSVFRPGHDQRHKGNLIRAMQSGDVEAEAELIARNWRTIAEIEELKSKALGKRERQEAQARAILARLGADRAAELIRGV